MPLFWARRFARQIKAAERPTGLIRWTVAIQAYASAQFSATHDFDGSYQDERLLVALRTDTVATIQEKNRQLRNALAILKWPRLVSFEVNGKTYNLPYDSAATAGRLKVPLPEARLRYLTGFFDGDGCVKCLSNLSGCSLAVGQSVARAEVLLLFCELFGGSVVRHSTGAGLVQPAVVWQVGGNKARSAASMLQLHSITKKDQLLLATQWPEEKVRRQQREAAIRSLKCRDSAVPGPCTPEYLAGFFDAEGYIRLNGKTRISLHIRQKFSTVLECLKLFLRDSFGIQAQLYSHSDKFHLCIGRTAESKQVLQAMLAAGLCGKAGQAELALGLTLQNGPEVRDAMAELVGKQCFGKKLDEEGLDRSRRIVRGQQQEKRLRRQGKLVEADAKVVEVERAKSEHKLCKARLENTQLHEYLCMMQEATVALGQSDSPCSNLTVESCSLEKTVKNGVVH